MKRVLIVEDEIPIAQLIRTNLSFADYEPEVATDGLMALDLIKEYHYDIIILDLMLPKMSGEELISKISQFGIPVIVLSAKTNLLDQVTLLKKGADDYITKPFESIDLLARVEAVLRRYNRHSHEIKIGEISINSDMHQVTKGTEVINLTSKEYELLMFLVQNRGKVLKREEIISSIWKYESTEVSRTVDIHIQRLRKKLDLYNDIKTVVKVGYMLKDVNYDL